MEKLKVKEIGVLRERERNDDSAAGTRGGVSGNVASTRQQQPKVSALDLASILNCRLRLEWTKDWLKKNQTEFLRKENLRKELQLRKNETYHLNCFFDITERQFRYLVTKLDPVIRHYEPHRRKKPFSAEERIAITLKYLATGEYHSCRTYCFRASKPVILKMISDICLNIYELLKDQFLSLPKTEAQWLDVVKSIKNRMRLPNCIGHITMRPIKFHSASRNEEEPNYNIKPPMIFTAITDSNNNFMYVDVEKTPARSKADIFELSNVKQLIENKTLPLPVYEEQLKNPNSADSDVKENGKDAADTYYFAGCGALPVKSYLLNSFCYVPTSTDPSYTFTKLGTPELDFCYAMDVANTHVEEALCALSNIFPILALPLRMEEANARKVVLGCVALYNFLRKTDLAFYRRTEKINRAKDKTPSPSSSVSIALDDDHDVGAEEDSLDDDDCILIANEEEQREREEHTPNVVLTSCFQLLHKQHGDTASGLARRKRLMQYIRKENIFN